MIGLWLTKQILYCPVTIVSLLHNSIITQYAEANVSFAVYIAMLALGSTNTAANTENEKIKDLDNANIDQLSKKTTTNGERNPASEN